MRTAFPTIMCKLTDEFDRQAAIAAGIITPTMLEPWLMFQCQYIKGKYQYTLHTQPSYVTHALRVTFKKFVDIHTVILLNPNADISTLSPFVMNTTRNLATLYYTYGMSELVMQTPDLNRSHARFKESRLKAGQY